MAQMLSCNGNAKEYICQGQSKFLYKINVLFINEDYIWKYIYVFTYTSEMFFLLFDKLWSRPSFLYCTVLQSPQEGAEIFLKTDN